MTAKEKEEQGISKYAPVKAVVKLEASGKVIERYYSVKEAAEKNGLRPSEICNAIRRKGKAKGMRFDHAKEQNRQVSAMPEAEKKTENFYFKHLPYGGVYS